MKKYIVPIIRFAMFESESVTTTASLVNDYTQGLQNWQAANKDGKITTLNYNKAKEIVDFTF